MKRIVLLLLTILTLRSQTYPYNDYVGLPDTGTMVWRVATWTTWQYDYAQPTFPGVYDYILTGDTIINGTHYRKLYRQIVQKGTYPTYHKRYINGVEGLLGLVRNDLSNRKVLFIPLIELPPNNPEKVLWDLSQIYPFNNFNNGIYSDFMAEPPVVKQGPGLYSCYAFYPNSFKSMVNKVDTVNILGKSRRRYWITTYEDSCNYYLNGWFIEGIGFEKGLIDVAYVGDWDTTWRVGYDSHFDVDICSRTGGCLGNLSGPGDCYTPFSKLLCVKYDTLEHAFVPGGCDVYPPVHRQNYVPFPEDSGAVWVNRSYWGELAKYYTGNIEFINGHKYVKVYKTGIFPSGATYTYYVGKYSNDTINQIVWLNNDFNEPYYNDEIPLYVFDSQAGHYVINFALRLLRHGLAPYEYFVFPWLDKVDTLNLNNELRRRYVYKVRKSYYNFPDSNRYSYKEINLDVIEGIGLLTQPFNNVQEMGVMWQWYGVTDTVYKLNCNGVSALYWQGVDESKFPEFICFKYKNFEYIVDTTQCELATGVLTKNKIKPEIKVLQDKIEVSALNPAIIEGVKIVNVLGQTMPVSVNLIGNKYETSTMNLPPGMYIIVVNTTNGIYSRKFYKQ